jgi:hypothetical protein
MGGSENLLEYKSVGGPTPLVVIITNFVLFKIIIYLLASHYNKKTNFLGFFARSSTISSAVRGTLSILDKKAILIIFLMVFN